MTHKTTITGRAAKILTTLTWHLGGFEKTMIQGQAERFLPVEVRTICTVPGVIIYRIAQVSQGLCDPGMEFLAASRPGGGTNFIPVSFLNDFTGRKFHGVVFDDKGCISGHFPETINQLVTYAHGWLDNLNLQLNLEVAA